MLLVSDGTVGGRNGGGQCAGQGGYVPPERRPVCALSRDGEQHQPSGWLGWMVLGGEHERLAGQWRGRAGVEVAQELDAAPW
jgi:hypothetical protein